jgi:hypothetical protein
MTRILALPENGSQNERSAECISGTAFHNAFRGLKPCCQSVWPSVLPTRRHWRESPLLALGLEAQPAPAVFAGDGRRSVERASPALRSSPAVQCALIRGAPARGCPPVNLPSLSSGWCNEPNLPPLARRIEKRPITHRPVLRRRLCAKVCAHHLCFAGRVPAAPLFATVHHIVLRTNVRISAYPAFGPRHAELERTLTSTRSFRSGRFR